MHTVVLVADEFIIALATQLELQRGCWHVVAVARTREQALEAVRLHQPDIVLLDLHLGRNQNSLDILPQLKRLTHGHVLVLGSNSDPEARRRARQNGADGFLNKPFSSHQLDATHPSLAA